MIDIYYHIIKYLNYKDQYKIKTLNSELYKLKINFVVPKKYQLFFEIDKEDFLKFENLNVELLIKEDSASFLINSYSIIWDILKIPILWNSRKKPLFVKLPKYVFAPLTGKIKIYIDRNYLDHLFLESKNLIIKMLVH